MHENNLEDLEIFEKKTIKSSVHSTSAISVLTSVQVSYI